MSSRKDPEWLVASRDAPDRDEAIEKRLRHEYRVWREGWRDAYETFEEFLVGFCPSDIDEIMPYYLRFSGGVAAVKVPKSITTGAPTIDLVTPVDTVADATLEVADEVLLRARLDAHQAAWLASGDIYPLAEFLRADDAISDADLNAFVDYMLAHKEYKQDWARVHLTEEALAHRLGALRAQWTESGDRRDFDEWLSARDDVSNVEFKELDNYMLIHSSPPREPSYAAVKKSRSEE